MPLDANIHPFLIAQEVRVMKIKKFEDLESWKKARQLTNAVYEATATGSFARDFDLKDQIRRASISILSNIAEGFERGGDREFLHFWQWPKYHAVKFALNSTSPSIKAICRDPSSKDYPTMLGRSAG